MLVVKITFICSLDCAKSHSCFDTKRTQTGSGIFPAMAASLADAEAQVEEMIAEVDGLDFSDPIWVYMGQVLDNFPELQTRLIRRMGAVEDGDPVPHIMHMGHIKYSHHLQCLSYIMMAKFQQNFRSSTCRSFNSSFVWASTAGGS